MANETKPIIVGQFFEELALQVFGGELCRNDDCDIYLRNHDLALEVKGSGIDSSYGMRLHVSQVDDYKKKCGGFPFNHGWYVFFAYRNKRLSRKMRKGKPTTELAKYKKEGEIHRYLASAVEWGLLVDLSIVNRWRHILPHSMKSVRGHLGLATVDIHCHNHLYPFRNGGLAASLEKLGLQPSNYTVFSGQIGTVVQPEMQFHFFREFSSYAVRFPMTAIVTNEQARIVRRIFSGRRLKLRSSRVQATAAA